MLVNISVIIATYNRCESLARVLSDLVNLIVPPGISWEVIVVDNNSTDETKQVVENLIVKGFTTFRYIFEGRQGKSYALNSGIKAARGEIILFTDDDVLIDQFWIQRIADVFEQYDCIGVAGKIIPLWSGKKPKWYTESGSHRLFGAIVSYDLGEESCVVTHPPFGANMAFKREVLNKYGIFRTDLGPYGKELLRGEDTEFCRRLMSAGESIIYSPKAIVYHPVEKQRTEKKYFRSWYFHYGRTLVRSTKVPQDVIRYLGVPRYLLRILAENFLRWAFAIGLQLRFYHQLEFCQTLGAIAESYKSRNR